MPLNDGGPVGRTAVGASEVTSVSPDQEGHRSVGQVELPAGAGDEGQNGGKGPVRQVSQA